MQSLQAEWKERAERHEMEIGREGEMMAAFSEEVRGEEIQRMNQRKSVDIGVGVDKCEW